MAQKKSWPIQQKVHNDLSYFLTHLNTIFRFYTIIMKNFQDILPLAERPSRYLGSETNCIRKDHAGVSLRVALAFPDMYEIGTSHFGIQILYHILNQHKDIVAERVFAPATDMEACLRSSDIPLLSLESQKPISSFDIIGFSLLYELNFTNILTMLDLAGLPFFASQRDDSHPFVIAGGPCTCNPEPIADFFDAIVVGDGEAVIMKMAEAWLNWKEGTGTRESLLKIWSGIEGVYIPAFFEPAQVQSGNGPGFQTLTPRFPDYTKVKRTIVNDLDTALFPETPIIPYGKPVHDRLRLEISRGCTRGCRFCQAGMIYRPVRERSPEKLLELSEASIRSTGYEDMSLLSLSTGDYECIGPLMEQLMARYASEHLAISLPSLRAGTLTPELMNLIRRVRKTGFTIAPEAGTQRLRDVINKNIGEADIFDTVKDAFDLGWKVIKLYFMVGLPTETDEDIEGIVDLVKELRKLKGPGGHKSKINVSVGTFIPKAHTPFQWAPQISLDESRDKIFMLQDELRMSGIQFKWQNPRVSLLEGLWARGDRSLSRLLVAAYKKGCKFDGWSDEFEYPLWKQAIEDEGVDTDFYTTRTRGTEEPLPWDHIDMGVTKDFLKKEWENALTGEHTPDCRDGDCNTCGVCDFDVIEPKIFKNPPEAVPQATGNERQMPVFKKLKVSYSKKDQAKYFGHLELVNIFLRAIRRAGIPVKYSEGFHPMPKISFDDPLPIGMESLDEFFYLTTPETVTSQNIVNGLTNAGLPAGLVVKGCEPAPGKSDRKTPESVTYLITVKEGFFSEDALRSFEERPEFILTRINRKGKVKKRDLKDAVLKMDLLTPQKLEMKLKSEPGKSVRPSDVIREIFRLSDEEIKLAGVIKMSK